MDTHYEKSTRAHHVKLRLVHLYEYLDENSWGCTKDYIEKCGRYTTLDLQRLWEDGRAIRYKCPDIALEFGGVHINSWFWATVEEAKRQDDADEKYRKEKANVR